MVVSTEPLKIGLVAGDLGIARKTEETTPRCRGSNVLRNRWAAAARDSEPPETWFAYVLFTSKSKGVQNFIFGRGGKGPL